MWCANRAIITVWQQYIFYQLRTGLSLKCIKTFLFQFLNINFFLLKPQAIKRPLYFHQQPAYNLSWYEMLHNWGWRKLEKSNSDSHSCWSMLAQWWIENLSEVTTFLVFQDFWWEVLPPFSCEKLIYIWMKLVSWAVGNNGDYNY